MTYKEALIWCYDFRDNIIKVGVAKEKYILALRAMRSAMTAIAKQIAEKIGAEFDKFDFTLPAARTEIKQFEADSLVIFGTPVYAGRVPNVLLKYLVTVQGRCLAHTEEALQCYLPRYTQRQPFLPRAGHAAARIRCNR